MSRLEAQTSGAPRDERPGTIVVAAAFLLGAAVLAALHVERGLDYWNYSEGVYALTARLMIRGQDVYGDVVAAQPPWQFVAGAGALSIHDSLDFLRLAVGTAQLVAGLLVARVVWLLTESRVATALAPALTLLTPWAVHEHGSLTPELLAPLPLLGAALLSRHARWAPAAGALAATAPFLKWPFLAATVAIVALSADPRRAARAAVGALALQAAVFTVVLGPSLWEDTVLAQLNSGRRGLGLLKGVWAQAAWNLLGLVVLAAVAVARRSVLREPRLFRVMVGLAVGLLLTLATNYKEGTGLNILVPIETVLLALALSGAVVLLRARRSPPAVAGAGLALAFTFAQTASLLASPRTATPFIFPTSERGAWGRAESGAEVEVAAASARRCPPGVAYSGPPFLAFVADRPMPADQPDQFLTSRSSTLADVLARINAVSRRCP